MKPMTSSGWGVRMAMGTTLALVVACNALTGVDALSTHADGALGPRPADDLDAASTRNDEASTPPPDGDGSTVFTSDAGSDATPDTGPLGFCEALSPKPTLCTDFDDGIFPGPWTVGQLGASTTTSTTAASRSPSRSLLLEVPGGADGAAFVTKAFSAAAATKITVAFSVLLDARDVARDLELGTILLGKSGGNRYEAQLELIADNELNIEEEAPEADGGVPQRDVALGANVTPGVWTRITWTIAFAGTSSTLTVKSEAGAASGTSSFGVAAHRYPGAPIVRLGDEYQTPYASKVHFDDVVVDIQ
jgi:hypothetical protein